MTVESLIEGTQHTTHTELWTLSQLGGGGQARVEGEGDGGWEGGGKGKGEEGWVGGGESRIKGEGEGGGEGLEAYQIANGEIRMSAERM